MDLLESPPSVGRKIKYDEFLNRCDERNAAEWVDGDVVYMTVSALHNSLNLEYWIVDPIRKQADFYLRGEDGYFRTALQDENGIYRSPILEGLWVDITRFWRKPLPPISEVSIEWDAA